MYKRQAYTSTRASNSLYFINEDDWVDYVIRFQNTGTDTAFNVVVTDTLPSTLDPATISLVTASHANTWSLQGQGTLKFIFPNILLPDSNVNEPLSHGLISFRIRPRLTLLPGTTIENIANIYFDFNPPVITEPSVLVAELSTGVGSARIEPMFLRPNPATDRVYVSEPSFATRVRSWEVLTSTGGIVLQGNGPIPATGIGIGHMENGAYLLRISTFNEINNLRFIKIGP